MREEVGGVRGAMLKQFHVHRTTAIVSAPALLEVKPRRVIASVQERPRTVKDSNENRRAKLYK